MNISHVTTAAEVVVAPATEQLASHAEDWTVPDECPIDLDRAFELIVTCSVRLTPEGMRDAIRNRSTIYFHEMIDGIEGLEPFDMEMFVTHDEPASPYLICRTIGATSGAMFIVGGWRDGVFRDIETILADAKAGPADQGKAAE